MSEGKVFDRLEAIKPLTNELTQIKNKVLEEEMYTLSKVIEKLEPVLPLLVHPIQTSYFCPGNVRALTKNEFYKMNGLILINRFEQYSTEKNFRGKYEGWQLVIFEDKSLHILERKGCWSNWETESSDWRVISDKIISPKDAIYRYRLDRILFGLQKEIDGAKDRLEKLLQDYKSRLETVQRIKEVI